MLVPLFIACKKEAPIVETTSNQKEIISTHLNKGAYKYHYMDREWGKHIDKGLEKDSTIAHLWQQKALPYWKMRKYEVALKHYNKAVKYDRQRYLGRRGFLKCIFQKNYEEALIDFNNYKKEFGHTYEQDHSIEFWIAICHLQLNEYRKAFNVLNNEIKKQEKEHGANWVNYLDRFYLGIIYLELEDYENAIIEFDKVLNEYVFFSDAQYYKAYCLNKLGEKAKAKKLINIGKQNYKNGFTFNEGSGANFEPYPYQIVWEWEFVESIIR
ncbi:conserved hypothetical protein [Tenacibaculum xiamenense]